MGSDTLVNQAIEEPSTWIRRDRITVIKDILETASKEDSTVTSLMYKANLNHKIMKKVYIPFLLRKGLLKKKQQTYRTTLKGMNFLHHCRRLNEMLR